MKIIKQGQPQVIMSNPKGRHNYFAWPTVAKLQDGRIAVAASGFRLRHVCPFGKTVIAYSSDHGKSYTEPAPVIDTVLDDRDGGILPFGENSVIVTSFNNTTDFQRHHKSATPNDLHYLDSVKPDLEKQDLGVNFRISHDGGETFGKLMKSPVTSPHGPTELPDGRLLWVGRTFSPENKKMPKDCIQAWHMTADGNMSYAGEIENIRVDDLELFSCEPHAIALDDGTVIAHIRVQGGGEVRYFTIYQAESYDGGKTWTKPHPILPRLGGAPPHLLKHSSGLLICTYGYRESPYGIKVMFSKDGGKTWDGDYDLYVSGISADLGYPSTIELSDDSLLTVFYAHETKDGPAVIMQQKWSFIDEI